MPFNTLIPARGCFSRSSSKSPLDMMITAASVRATTVAERGVSSMMDISPVVTRVSSVSVVEGAGGVIQSSAPNLDVAQVSSIVRAKSGDTVVLGGLIQTQESYTERGLPGLNRLGPLSRAFGGRYENRVRKELIMVLTPTIVAAEG